MRLQNTSSDFGNYLTLEELSQIEERAHHSKSKEAAIILRLAAALREAMQIRENAIALMSLKQGDVKKATQR